MGASHPVRVSRERATAGCSHEQKVDGVRAGLHEALFDAVEGDETAVRDSKDRQGKKEVVEDESEGG